MDSRRKRDGRALLNRFDEGEEASDGEETVWVEDLLPEEEAEIVANFAFMRSTPRGNRDDGDSAFTGMVNNMISFVIDTGATEHVVNRRDCFFNIRKLDRSRRVTCANKNSDADLVIEYVGDVVIEDDNGRIGCLRNVYFAPELTENLFSLRKFTSQGFECNFSKFEATFKIENQSAIIKRGTYDGRFWRLTFTLPLSECSKQRRLEIINLVESKAGVKYGNQALISSVLSTDFEMEGNSAANESLNDDEINPSDLENLNKSRTSNLRETSGILWHLRMNHASRSYLQVAAKFLPELKGVKFPLEIVDCEACIQAKQKKESFSGVRSRAKRPLFRVHSDLLGPFNVSAINSKSNYLITFSDDYSRYLFVYGLFSKSQVHLALKSFIRDARRVCGDDRLKIVELRTDQGTEYQTEEVVKLLREEGIEILPSGAEQPKHNGVSERVNLEIEEKARALLISSGMPMMFWEYAAKFATEVHNRTPNSSIDFRAPFELFTGNIPKVKFIRRFGCVCYVLKMERERNVKMKPRSHQGFLVGLNETGYTVFLKDVRKFFDSKHVRFVESRVYRDVNSDNNSSLGQELKNVRREYRTRWREKQWNVELDKDDAEDFNSPTEPYDRSDKTEKAATEQPQFEVTGEKFAEDDEFEYYEEEIDGSDVEVDAGILCAFVDGDEPQSYTEAMNRDDRDKWWESILEEFDAHQKCKTWNLIRRSDVPRNEAIIKARWVHKIKVESNGESRYKSRLVAKGYADRNEYDRSEVYAPVARLSDVRFILILANKWSLEILQFDVKTAFLNGTLNKRVYMEVPEGLAIRERGVGDTNSFENLRFVLLIWIEYLLFSRIIKPRSSSRKPKSLRV